MRRRRTSEQRRRIGLPTSGVLKLGVLKLDNLKLGNLGSGFLGGMFYVVLVLVGVCHQPLASAKEPNDDYTLTLTDAESFPAAAATVTAQLANDGDDLSGYQFGVCHDTKFLSLDEDDVIALEADDLDYNFSTINVYDTEGNVGWAVGLLMNIVIGAVIEPGDYDLYEATYYVNSETMPNEEGIDVPLEWCDGLGVPKITILVVVEGTAISPTQVDGNIHVSAYPAAFRYQVSEGVLEYRTDTGENEEPGRAVVSIEEIPDILPEYPTETRGFQCALSHDSQLVQPTAVEALEALEDLNDGTGPSFFEVDFEPENGPGLTVGIVYSLTLADATVVDFEVETDVLEISYDGVAENLVGTESTDSLSALEWQDDLGRPVVVNEVIIDGLRLEAETVDGNVVLSPLFVPPFMRGDCNSDSLVNLADGIWILDYLFREGQEASCLEACDVNDDGFRDQSDAIYVLNYRFLTGVHIPEPFPDCGTTGEETVPDCDIQESCL